ncbi:MAG TPA: integrase arm-type DNA-binding domain-containing protein [Dongiaceae bacterium]|nr:integrase arm-type DNA-binding domain-containing protein [Dongiaceae bacterium]
MPRSLTDAVVQNQKPERGQQGWREIADGACRGLCLRISPTGEKVWAIRYVVAGKRQRHTVGAYPTVSLSEARKRATDYRSAGRDGIRADEVDAQRRARTLTMADAHAEYLVSIEGALRSHTRRLKRDMFRHHIEPALGGRIVASIRGSDIADLVSSVVAKGYQVQANRVYSEIMALLRWCEQKSYVAGVPSSRRKDMRKVGAAKEMPRRRTLTDMEIASLWNLACTMGPLTCDFTHLLILTGQRLSEVREMQWHEINLKEALWIIPGGRYKTGLDHVVPLSKPVLDILMSRWTEGAVGYVLSGGRTGKCFNGHASAMQRIRKKVGKRADYTWHDIRRTVRSGLSRLGTDDRTAEMTIGHAPQGMIKTYDVHDRLDERRMALTGWAQFVEALVVGQGNVVPLRTVIA